MKTAPVEPVGHTRWTTIPGSQLRLAPGAEVSGLAVALRELIALNVRGNREAARVFGGLDVAAAVRLADMAAPITLDFRAGNLRVYSGDGPRSPHVQIITDARALMTFCEAPKLAGLPDPRTAEGRGILRWLLGGRLRLRGVLRHPLALRGVALLTSSYRRDRGEWPPRTPR